MVTSTKPLSLERIEFAQRFNQIARKRGLNSTGLLLLPPNYPGDKDTAERRDDDIERSGSTGTLIVPGLLGNSLRSLVAPFLCARDRLTVHGYDVTVAWVSGRSGCVYNARVLREHVLDAADRTGRPVNLIAYSKGCADSLEMLGSYPDASDAVSALVSYAGIVHGTPLAEAVPDWMNTVLRYIPLPGESFGDGLAISDLSRLARRAWFAQHDIDKRIRLASVVAVPESEMVSRVLKSSYRRLSTFSSDNDSQVIDSDAILPASELLAVVNADHWAIALPIAERFPRFARLLVDRNQFPRDVMLQAIIDHLAAAPES